MLISTNPEVEKPLTLVADRSSYKAYKIFVFWFL